MNWRPRTFTFDLRSMPLDLADKVYRSVSRELDEAGFVFGINRGEGSLRMTGNARTGMDRLTVAVGMEFFAERPAIEASAKIEQAVHRGIVAVLTPPCGG